MQGWFKANGGPLALAVVGLALAGYTTPFGWALVALGLVWYIAALPPVRRRLPIAWVGFRRDLSTVAASGDLPSAASWRDAARRRIKRKLSEANRFVQAVAWNGDAKHAAEFHPNDPQAQHDWVERCANQNARWVEPIWKWHREVVAELHATGRDVHWLYSEEVEKPTRYDAPLFLEARMDDLKAILDRL